MVSVSSYVARSAPRAASLDPALAAAAVLTPAGVEASVAAVAWSSTPGGILRALQPAEQWATLSRMLELAEVSPRVSELLASPDFVGALGAVGLETRSRLLRQTATGLLARAFVRAPSDEVADVAARALVLGHGSAAPREIARNGGSPERAVHALHRARWRLHEPMTRSARDEPLLNRLGMTGEGTTVRVADLRNSDHFVHTLALAHPPGARSRLLDYGLDAPGGKVLLDHLKDALALATGLGEHVFSISLGADAEADGYPEYSEHLRELAALIDGFPGLVVVAAGNGGARGLANDLALSSRALVATALDVPERAWLPSATSSQHHPDRVLGIGATAIAPGQDGADRLLGDQTSWCAPQVGDLVARVVQLSRDVGMGVDPLGGSRILLGTAEAVEGGALRADGVAAGAWVHCRALLEQHGSGRELRVFGALSREELREVVLAVEPFLGPPGTAPRQPALVTLRAALQG